MPSCFDNICQYMHGSTTIAAYAPYCDYVYKICIAIDAANILIYYLSFISLFALLLLLSYPALTAFEPHFGHAFSLC